MKPRKSLLSIGRWGAPLFLSFGFLCACPFDDTLKEYLDIHFWLPFSHQLERLEDKKVRRASAPFAGMGTSAGATSLEKLRAAYQDIREPVGAPMDLKFQRQALSTARADQSLTAKEREEVELLDAKMDMRAGEVEAGSESLVEARRKLQAFLKTARTSEFLSEARGWLAHVYHLLGDQTAAGKIYLDELNRPGSNLSRETLLTSLRMNYGYTGGPALIEHLDEYFDTPEHAAFAIQIATNPTTVDRWDRQDEFGRFQPGPKQRPYDRVRSLLESHKNLFQSNGGADLLAGLSMRIALRMGDVQEAIRVAAMVPPAARVRRDPDFEWMLGSAYFLSHQYSEAEKPLLQLFASREASANQKSAAAYGLCGVYSQTKNIVEQIRFALWLDNFNQRGQRFAAIPNIQDQSLYWASSGWDLGILLDAEASVDDLNALVQKYPVMAGVRIVKYSLAVQLSRAQRYEEAATIYQEIHAVRRAPRLRELAALYRETLRADLPVPQRDEARYRLAQYLLEHEDGIYFNDALWSGLQRYALEKYKEPSVPKDQHQATLENDRRVKDLQEERWQAYLILREVMRSQGKSPLGRKAALSAIRSLDQINVGRFGRTDDIRKADRELLSWLKN